MSASLIEIDQAIYTRLRADTTLMAMLPGGLRRSLAPQTARRPYLIYQREGGPGDQYSLNKGYSHVELDYFIRVVVEGFSVDVAAQATDRVYTLLMDTTLTITGWAPMDITRIGIREFPEDHGDVVIQHIGAVYRIKASPL